MHFDNHCAKLLDRAPVVWPPQHTLSPPSRSSPPRPLPGSGPPRCHGRLHFHLLPPTSSLGHRSNFSRVCDRTALLLHASGTCRESAESHSSSRDRQVSGFALPGLLPASPSTLQAPRAPAFENESLLRPQPCACPSCRPRTLPGPLLPRFLLPGFSSTGLGPPSRPLCHRAPFPNSRDTQEIFVERKGTRSAFPGYEMHSR